MVALPGRKIIVCSVHEVGARFDECDNPAILSIEHPGAMPGDGKAPDYSGRCPQQVLCFYDIEQWALQAPAPRHVRQGLDFMRAYRNTHDLIIHCKAGMARSTAFAYAEIATRMGDGQEMAALEYLLSIRPIASPNFRIVRFAERILKYPRGHLAGPLLINEAIRENWGVAHLMREQWLKQRPELALLILRGAQTLQRAM